MDQEALDQLSIEELIERAICAQQAEGEARPAACTERLIEGAATAFESEFGVPLPDAYKRVLRLANGLNENGLYIWPVRPKPDFSDTLFSFNRDLRDRFSNQFIYFAEMDGEELYAFDTKAQVYRAIEYTCKDGWKDFSSAEEMFEFILRRALNWMVA